MKINFRSFLVPILGALTAGLGVSVTGVDASGYSTEIGTAVGGLVGALFQLVAKRSAGNDGGTNLSHPNSRGIISPMVATLLFVISIACAAAFGEGAESGLVAAIVGAVFVCALAVGVQRLLAEPPNAFRS